MTNSLLYEDITGIILNAFFNVYNKLGYGFLEKVYENAMMIELKKLGLKAERQNPIKVFYDEQIIGDYYADIVVEGVIILELKAIVTLASEHEVQLLNYLKATDLEVGLLLNFGPKPQHKRRVLTKEYKNRR